MKKLILIIGLLTVNAFAGNEKGNGGDAIVCRDGNGKIIKSELLDYYEGRTYRQIPHVFENISHQDFFKLAGQKLATIDQNVFKNFEIESLELLEALLRYRQNPAQQISGYIFTDGVLTDIADSGHLLMPRNCTVEQLVIRTKPVFPEDPKFIIQAEILRSLSEDDFRGIILHEVIYGAFIQYLRETDSIKARYFHQLLTSKSVSLFSYKDFLEFSAVSFKSRIVKLHGHEFNLSTFKVIDPNHFSLKTEWLELILNQDGQVDKERTKQLGHIDFKSMILDDSRNQRCVADYEIVPSFEYLNSRGETGTQPEVKQPFGNFRLKVVIPALNDENKGCRHSTMSYVFGDWSRMPKHLFSFKLKKQPQTFEINLFLDFNEKLEPVVLKQP